MIENITLQFNNHDFFFKYTYISTNQTKMPHYLTIINIMFVLHLLTTFSFHAVDQNVVTIVVMAYLISSNSCISRKNWTIIFRHFIKIQQWTRMRQQFAEYPKFHHVILTVYFKVKTCQVERTFLNLSQDFCVGIFLFILKS